MTRPAVPVKQRHLIQAARAVALQPAAHRVVVEVASWLASFDYSYMIFAVIWGFVFWRDVPDRFTILGMAMIGGAGIFVAWRERQDKRAPVPIMVGRYGNR